MKVLIATDGYTHNMGGVTASVLALCDGLRQQGNEVKVLALSNGNQSYRKGDDYFIRSIPAFFYPGMRWSFARKDSLLREIADWGPDIVHVQTEGSAYRLAFGIANRNHVPLVMTCHTDYAHFVFGNLRSWFPIRKLMCALGKRIYRPAVRVIAPSVKAAQFPFLKGVSSRLTIVPNGLELEKYRTRFSDVQRRAFRRSMGFDDSAIVLVAVSRLSREKNLRELIACFPELQKRKRDVKLLIVGDGPDRRHLERMAKKACIEDRVVFTGKIPAENVWQYYSAGDIFVSASTFEVHSMSYLEALASGLPLLCRADDALDGVLIHGANGFAYHSQKEFVDFALRLSEEDILRKGMGCRSLLEAEHFSSGTFAAAVFKVYEDAIRRCAECEK